MKTGRFKRSQHILGHTPIDENRVGYLVEEAIWKVADPGSCFQRR